MRKIVLIGGEPATGKTTMMWRLMKHIGYQGSLFDWGLVRGTYDAAHRLCVLGLYDDLQTFSGTDRLSMAVTPQAVRFLKQEGPFAEFCLLLEGDRLFNSAFIAGAREHCPLEVYVLTCEAGVLKDRHRLRGDHQRTSWLAGRKTKVDNLASKNDAVILPNNTPCQHAAALDVLIRAIRK